MSGIENRANQGQMNSQEPSLSGSDGSFIQNTEDPLLNRLRGLMGKRVSRRKLIGGGIAVATVALTVDTMIGHTESLAPLTNPYTFTDSLGRQRSEDMYMAAGLTPETSRLYLATFDDYVDGSYARTYQVDSTQYEEVKQGTSYGIGASGLLVDISSRRFYLFTAVWITHTSYARLEIGRDINNPTDLSAGARKVFFAGLPQGGNYGDPYAGAELQTSNNGKRLVVSIRYSRNDNESNLPTENGIYSIDLDKDGYPIGGFVKMTTETTPTSTPTTTPTNTPTSTPTPRPTEKPVVSPTPVLDKKIFLPWAAAGGMIKRLLDLRGERMAKNGYFSKKTSK